MKFNQQQTVADTLMQYRDAFIICALNAYELAGKLLDAVREEEVNGMALHDCKLDEWLSGSCDHPSHDYELVEQKAETESEAWRGAL